MFQDTMITWSWGSRKGWRGDSEEYGRTWGLDRGSRGKVLKDEIERKKNTHTNNLIQKNKNKNK